MKNIKKIINSKAAYNILDNSNCEGSTWTEGGCAILAQALNSIEGYPIYVIYNKKFNGAEHLGVMTPNGSIIDADGEHKNASAWLRFFKENELPRPGELIVVPFNDRVKTDGIKFDEEASNKLAELIRSYKVIQETVKSVLFEELISKTVVNNYLKEFESYIDSITNVLNELDKPVTFEWDIAKEKIDKSKRFIKNKEEAYGYLNRILNKIKSLPNSIKIKITRYVIFSLIGIIGYSAMQDIVRKNVPEIADKLNKEIESEINRINPRINKVSTRNKKVYLEPRNSSNSLLNILKNEEGSAYQKGEPILSAYKLGDGMITIGWGHAEKIGDSQFIPGQKITRKKAEELLASDISDAEMGLNNILDDWKKNGIKVKITQPMYDAMVSMIFNMGIGNFRKSDFIQLVKAGKYNKAAEKILTTNVSYPGHIPRRKKESELFAKGINKENTKEVNKIVKEDVRKIIGKALKEEIELKNISDDDEYWDRVKIIAKNKKGEEVGYAILDMAISPESEFAFMDDEHAYTDDEIEKYFPDDFASKLEHIEVYPNFRKKGYGKELMDAVVKYVKSRNFKTLYLIAAPIGFEPRISLDDLSKFYSGYGFEVIKDFGNAHDMVAQLREDSIQELALRTEDLPDTAALFVVNENNGYTFNVYDPNEKKTYGTISIFKINDNAPIYSVSGIAAEKGFGPFIYELAMMHINGDNSGLMPSRDGDVRGEAWNVWEKFYDRNDVKKITMNPDSSLFKFDILFSEDDFDSEKEKYEWLKEADPEEKRIIKIFNSVYFLNKNNQYKELFLRGEKYKKQGIDIQSVIDSGEDLWYSSY